MRTEGTSTGGGHGPIVSKVEKIEPQLQLCSSISGLVVEYIVAIDVARVRFPADAWWQHHAALPAAARKAVLALAVKLPHSGRDIKCGPGHVDRAACFWKSVSQPTQCTICKWSLWPVFRLLWLSGSLCSLAPNASTSSAACLS